MSEIDERSDPRLDAALDECCRRVQRGENLERCLADYPPDYRGELARLVPIGSAVAVVARDPSPAFQAYLHDLLLGEPKRAPLVRWQDVRRRVMTRQALKRAALVALVAIALVGGGASAVTATQESLPDNPLYSLKEAQESAQLWMAPDTETRIGVNARQVARRAVELRLAVRAGKPEPVVADLSQRLSDALDLVVDQALDLRANGRPAPALRARGLMFETERRLRLMTPEAPVSLQPSLRELLGHVQEQNQRLRALPDDRPAPTPRPGRRQR